MSIVIDIVIIAIILICLYGGYRKGLIGLAFSIVSFILAALIALILFNPISSYVINNFEYDDNIKEAIIKNFNSETEENAESKDDFLTSYINEQIEEVKGATVETVAINISEICVKGIVFIALFIVVRIALIFVKVIANLIAKLPILNQVNKLGGIVFGLLKGLLITYGILAVLLLVSPMFNDAKLFKEIDNSFIGSMMYNNNIIIKFLF